jgi:RHS repeat-associated protein
MGLAARHARELSYDTLNRLTSGSDGLTGPNGPASPNYCWQYDAFGNRTLNYAGACAPDLPQINYSTSNHLLTGLQAYDAAGNITTDAGAGNSYLYDAEDRICAVSSQGADGFAVMTGYVYNADGVRVAKGPINTMSCDPATSGLLISNESDYVIGPSGEQLTEMGNGGANWAHTNVFVAGELFATYDPNGLHFYANDWLGNRRVQTDYAGVPEQACTNLPFGDSLTCSQSLTTPTEHHFTGKERDAESGNDYFGARYFGSSMGRFTSPDNGEDQSSTNPQSWNLYSYGRNNPLIGIDADGHTYHVCDASGKNCSNIDDATFEAEQKKDQANGESFANGTLSHTDANGNQVKDGSFTHDPDIAGNPASNIAAFGRIGNQGIGAIKVFAVGSVVGGAIGGAALTAAGTEAGLSILTEDLEGVLARAGSSVGNQGAKVASREVAEEAAKEWVGEGARPITSNFGGQAGPQVGWESADGTKVARFNNADTRGYINLVNKITGGNLHVGW